MTVGAVLIAGALVVPVSSISASSTPLAVVPSVDYARYSGTWFEIARLPNRFQAMCAGDVTAVYAPRPDGRIGVTNRCRESSGRLREAAGVARRVDGEPSSVLKVRFAPAFLSFLPMVWGDYQVLALGQDYDYAMVGSPNRSYLWVLSRTPTIDAQVYRKLVADAESQGFKVSALVETPHTTR
jgi:apolipoprotein D and lipocalin family protein